MAVLSALAVGAVLGVRHALEADHLAAVATLVEEENAHSCRIGVSWGVGHSLPIIVLGVLFVVAGVRLPTWITAVARRKPTRLRVG